MPPTVTDEAERSRQGWIAIYEHIQRSLVFIVEGRPNEHKFGKGHGSGTLVRTPGGQTVVLTATHVLRDHPDGHSLGGFYLGDGAVADPFASVWRHPTGEDGVDVAVALLTDEAANVFRLGAVTIDSIAESSVELGEKDPTVISGFPAALRTQKVDHANKINFQGYASMAYNTRVVGFDQKKSRYQMAWDEGIAESDDAIGLMKVFGMEAGKVFKQPEPGGISGGPLWRLAPVKTGKLWSADKAATIIGITESWDKESVAFCPAVRVWGDWFRDVVRAVDSGEGGR